MMDRAEIRVSMSCAINDWLPSAFARDNWLDDLHFDVLSDKGVQLDWKSLVGASCDVVANLMGKLADIPATQEVSRVVLLLPLAGSERLMTWNDNLWERVGIVEEPPVLVLMKEDRLLEHFDEEYFRRLDMPIDVTLVQAFFRSYRYFKGPGATADFANGIFVTTC